MREGFDNVEWLARTRAEGDVAAWLALVPYARRIGVSVLPDPQGEGLLFRLAPREGNVGNVLLPALHGGVVAAFMETAATLDLMLATRAPRAHRRHLHRLSAYGAGGPDPGPLQPAARGAAHGQRAGLRLAGERGGAGGHRAPALRAR